MELRRYVREILWIRSTQARTQILLPETAFTLVLRQSGAAALRDRFLPSAVVSGLQPCARSAEHGPNSSFIAVRFTEIGAAAVLHNHAGLFYSQTLALDAVLPRQWVENLQSALTETPHLAGQIAIVERYLLERIRQAKEIPAQIEAAARILRNSGGRVAIPTVAHRVAMSQSALERGMRAYVGASPKMLARLARLQNVCQLWDAGFDLTRIAQEAGYSDQPHLVHDFRLFTGLSPQAFFRNPSPRNLPNFYQE